MKYFHLFFLFAFSSIVGAQQNGLDSLIYYYDAGDYQKVIDTAGNIIWEASSAIAYYYRGISYYQINDLENAKLDLEFLINNYGSVYNSLSWLAYIYFDLRNYEGAIEICYRISAEQALDNDMLMLRSLSFAKLKKYDEAVADISMILKTEKQAGIYQQRANFYLKSGNLKGFLSDIGHFAKPAGLLAPPLLFLLGFIISLVFYKVISRKNISPQQKYAQYARYTNMINFPSLFLFIYLVYSLDTFNSVLQIIITFEIKSLILIYLISAFLISITYYAFVFFSRIIISYWAAKKWRNIDATFGRHFKLSSVFFVYILMIQIALIGHNIFIGGLRVSGPVLSIISFAAAAFLVFLVMIFYPQIIALFYGKDRDLGQSVSSEYLDLLKTCGIRAKKINIVKTSDIRLANAWVSGIGIYSIFITDYLLKHFTFDEVKNVLAHEAGHIRLKHLFYNYLLALFWLFSSYLISKYISDEYLVTLAYTMLYFIFFIRFIGRRFEYQADHFAVENTGQPLIYIQMLRKIGKANWSPLRFRRIEEKMMTHPSIEKRIQRISRDFDIEETVWQNVEEANQ